MIDVKDGRGKHKSKIRQKNLDTVKNWFTNNPGKSAVDCFNDKKINLSYVTIRSCIKELRCNK